MEKENSLKKECLQKISSKGGKMSVKICTMIDSCSCNDYECCKNNKKRLNT